MSITPFDLVFSCDVSCCFSHGEREGGGERGRGKGRGCEQVEWIVIAFKNDVSRERDSRFFFIQNLESLSLLRWKRQIVIVIVERR